MIKEASQLLRCAAGDLGQLGAGGEAARLRELDDLLTLAENLKRVEAMSHARRLLARIAEQAPEAWPSRDRAQSEYALCTYKDPDLSLDFRLQEALAILRRRWDLTETVDREVLGLAGAIHKRRWETSGQKEDLERSVAYYRRGYAENPTVDQGYTAINTAFVIDQLAWIEQREANATGGDDSLPRQRAEEASKIRSQIVSQLEPEDDESVEDYWLAATLAEAHLGLACDGRQEGHRTAAARWLARARALNPDPWKLQTTARQLLDLSRIRGRFESAEELADSEMWQVIRDCLGKNTPSPQTVFLGKVGLALSGGGFRASLFHIGVLARLAELDMLRHVEVISCVSGGSILGAHYYLELKHLLETKSEAELERSDYIELVERLANDFLAGIKKNIRMRVGSDLLANLRMIFDPRYSRTHRLGELYERHLYRRVKDKNGDANRDMSGLFIKPKDVDGRFDPKADNWRRKHKVPTLVLNATSLNTGHNWQFTASWMGESPGAIHREVDANERLRRLYYDEQAPPKHRKVRLGHAVAASSCVPGAFEPLALKGLYEGRTVRLVDGGLYDNQGIVGLIEQGCDVLMVSDACGQLASIPAPGEGMVPVLVRANGLMMERIRVSEFADLDGMRRSNQIRGLLFLHLKKDLDAEQVDWIDCQDPHDASEFAKPRSERGANTSYNVPKIHQRRLADIRTDLDTFNDTEAFALMESGYRMTKAGFPRAIDFVASEATEHPWHFHAVAEQLEDGRADTKFTRLLDVASSSTLKAWSLSPVLRVLGRILTLAAIVASVWVLWNLGSWEISGKQILAGLALTAVSLSLGKGVAMVLAPERTLRSALSSAAFAVFGFVLAWGHILLIDPVYRAAGRLSKRHDPKASH